MRSMAGRGTTRAPAPLRPGPAGPDRAAELRDRILDAAAACLMEAGLDARLHAQIAQRAVVSRPTVYKYVGDQDAVVAALLERELDRFVEAVLPRLHVGASDDLVAELIDGVVLIVDYARAHELLQTFLRDHPEIILPALTTGSDAVLDQVLGVFEKPLGAAIAGRVAVSPRVAAEWFYRLVVSLITTPGSARATPEELRDYVGGLVQVLGVTASSPASPAR